MQLSIQLYISYILVRSCGSFSPAWISLLRGSFDRVNEDKKRQHLGTDSHYSLPVPPSLPWRFSIHPLRRRKSPILLLSTGLEAYDELVINIATGVDGTASLHTQTWPGASAVLLVELVYALLPQSLSKPDRPLCPKVDYTRKTPKFKAWGIV